ncbi:Putative squalene/phytoene synthase, isoprenoid synthase domain superfamily, lycopene cyclase [Septoria linicola]|uniref:Bifunctional lycopene cyclase/phytoene synthase n=1 Tax=Septoria linicola TaxID=215465 RepID=A0A9Q9AML3_9PEZI|nr:putative squalene/phytoene synthase, isoprenoid synthase domain superfamily, lycopene cyclase [Septoria linicola]USW50889.1 Putative squalene/phytoene synthase, isoprenoid synthase domain superfamily, lycopene cyclase [Septoria linicola]
MGYDYALVHLTYTIPPAFLLSALYYPLWTKLDSYKIGFLITIAVVSTIPWDSYLIRTNIWSYPPNVVIGWTIFDIPVEEVFFFVIQTYTTSLLYLLTSKAVLKETLIVKEVKGDPLGQQWKYIRWGGQMVLGLTLRQGVSFVREGKQETYLGLILVWALPFLLLLWSLGYQFLVGLPLLCTWFPIALPTVYLWVVDTLALKRGTWVISQGTKTGRELWPNLEIEEAVFFLLTNCLIVFGLVAFDNAMAVLNAFPAHFKRLPELPSPYMLVEALLLPAAVYDDDRVFGLQQSVERLKRKSRSFYLASSTFQGRLRIDLILLYSFCRVADDLIDNAADEKEAREWLKKLSKFLDLSYGLAEQNAQGDVIPSKDVNRGQATLFIMHNFPPETQLTLMLLPTHCLSKEPLYELLQGFEMDLAFTSSKSKGSSSGPIKTEADLDLYGARVAGTVALLCIQLVLHHNSGSVSDSQARRLMKSGHDMGVALQYTNIARDLSVDAQLNRCYVPPPWLKKEKLSPEAFVAGLVTTGKVDDFFWKKVEVVRGKLLDRAFEFYNNAIPAVEELPKAARAPMRVAVESYMQIGRELRNSGSRAQAGNRKGRATVPKWKRVWVAWKRLLGPAPREDR